MLKNYPKTEKKVNEDCVENFGPILRKLENSVT